MDNSSFYKTFDVLARCNDDKLTFKMGISAFQQQVVHVKSWGKERRMEAIAACVDVARHATIAPAATPSALVPAAATAARPVGSLPQPENFQAAACRLAGLIGQQQLSGRLPAVPAVVSSEESGLAAAVGCALGEVGDTGSFQHMLNVPSKLMTKLLTTAAKGIGKGGYGQAFLLTLASGTTEEQKLVAKTIAVPHASCCIDMQKLQGMERALQAEHIAGMELRHPNIVRLIGTGAWGPDKVPVGMLNPTLLVLLFSYCDSRDLAHVPHGSTLLAIIGAMVGHALALAHVHDKNWLHLDVTPANMFLHKSNGCAW
jgi:hypothetical protein